jgi:hypothetical protein
VTIFEAALLAANFAGITGIATLIRIDNRKN